VSGPGNTKSAKKQAARGFDSGVRPAGDQIGNLSPRTDSGPDDYGQRNVRHQAINGAEHPTPGQVMGISVIRNLVNLGPQMTDHVLMRPRASKEDFPGSTPPTGGIKRDRNGRLRAYHVRAVHQHPGGPETHGTARAMGHDPIDTPPTDFIKYVEGVDRHPQCQTGCSGLCAGLCARQYVKARNAVTSDFPKMNSTISSGGVVTRVPGGGHQVVS
jgi:hypothetical protein